MKSRRRIAAAVALALLGPLSAKALHVSAAPSNAITIENARAGKSGWNTGHLQGEVAKGPLSDSNPASFAPPPTDPLARGVPTTNVSNAGLSDIVGWADAQSINQGEPIGLHISSKVPRYDIVIYRMGWYGGAGGIVMQESLNRVGTLRTSPSARPGDRHGRHRLAGGVHREHHLRMDVGLLPGPVEPHRQRGSERRCGRRRLHPVRGPQRRITAAMCTDPVHHLPGVQRLRREEPVRVQLDRRAQGHQGLLRPTVLANDGAGNYF